MKPIFKSLTTAVVLLCLIHCTNSSSTVAIQGEVKDAGISEITLSGRGQEHNIPLDSLHRFSATLELPTGFYKLTVGTHESPIYLETGKTVALTVRYKDEDQTFDFQDSENQVILAHKDL